MEKNVLGPLLQFFQCLYSVPFSISSRFAEVFVLVVVIFVAVSLYTRIVSCYNIVFFIDHL